MAAERWAATRRAAATQLGPVGRALVVAVTALGALAGCDGRRERAGAVDATEVRRAAAFAELDTMLSVAIRQGQLAALRAQDVGLRAFAVRQVARYGHLREELRAIAAPHHDGAIVAAAPAPAPADTQMLLVLQEASGASFDRLYVRAALDLHRDLLQRLDATLHLVPDAGQQATLRRVRGTVGADDP